MDKIGKITRVSIFIDHDNFTIAYCEKFDKKEKDISIWDTLSELFVGYYKAKFIKNDFEVVDHVGTFICVGLSEYYFREKWLREQHWEKKKRYEELDKKNGIIMKYGHRAMPDKDKQNHPKGLGKEKGVDAEIICQMLMGAFLDHYDACILMSDDGDYIPAVERVQDYFGKKVIQAGFNKDSKLRERTYGHILLELADKEDLSIPEEKLLKD